MYLEVFRKGVTDTFTSEYVRRMAEKSKLKLSKQQPRYWFYFEMVKRSLKNTINVFRG